VEAADAEGRGAGEGEEVRADPMGLVLSILFWPVAAAFRLCRNVLVWLQPSLAQGRRLFPQNIQQMIEQATKVTIHYLEPDSDLSHIRSLGTLRLDSAPDRRRVIRSVVKANRECLGGFLCMDTEYAIEFESVLDRVGLTICFWCMQVWVAAEAENANRYYTISARPQALLDRLLNRAGVPKPIRERRHA
jgi:hypothetical protein